MFLIDDVSRVVPTDVSREVAMSLTPIEFQPFDPMLIVLPWRDAVVDPTGFDPRSHYVELFWLNVLGPTATWILRRMMTGLDEYPDGYELDLDQTAKAMGLTFASTPSNPFSRGLTRCVWFGVAHRITGGLAVRQRLPLVGARHLRRMPEHLQRAHLAWQRGVTATDEAARAGIIADALFETGDAPEVVERQLLHLGVSPRATSDALRTRAEPRQIDALHSLVGARMLPSRGPSDAA